MEPLSWSQQSFFSSPHNSPTKNGGALFMNGPVPNSYIQNRRSSAATGPTGSYYGPTSTTDFYQQQQQPPLPPATNYHSAASYSAAVAMSNPEFSSGVRLMHGGSFSRGQQPQQPQQPPLVLPPEVSVSDFDKEAEETRRKSSNEPDLRKVSINELDRRQNLTNR